ncbi:ATP-binding protein [Streptomyces huasconensis]|uniref:ATP-binding protein n=1 Tax=Streptomyces huasconensis TaxID=1854574 RepID=UPI0036FC9CFD
MKQSAAKTLGVAALGAAFAAAGAGSANAAPGVPDAAAVLGQVTSALPLEQAAKTLPAGSPEAVAAGKSVLAGGLKAAGNADRAAAAAQADDGRDDRKGGRGDGRSGGKSAGKPKPASPLPNLLGGVPLGGTGLNGLPLG